MRQLFNDGWQFSLGEGGLFSPVQLPHDWLIQDPGHFFADGVGWYKRRLDIGLLMPGELVSLRFDGVYMDSSLFVNERPAGEWKYGFTAFEHDITSLLRQGEPNEILLRVEVRQPSARWYTGAGICRDVYLVRKNACHFAQDGLYVSTYFQAGAWGFRADAEVVSGGLAYEVRHTRLEEGETIAWSPENPQLYTLRSELIADGKVQDTLDTRFGYRSAAFSPQTGFSLNGKTMKLNGVCLHQEFSILGAAAHPDMIRRQFAALKAMGVNAVRTAHNPPGETFMDLADEMGLLVVSELTDVWEKPKTAFDYARFFNEWVERDAASWIRRDRNHPSVILWSLGNEIPDTHLDARRGGEILRHLMAQVLKHDPRVNARATLCSNYLSWENTRSCADIIKLIGYNYAEHLYHEHHEKHPDWVIFGSETGSTVQSRGVYHFPLRQMLLADDDLQCSSLGNSATSWGAKNIQACIEDDRGAPFSLGQFVWAGQDYLGEPTPYHTKNSYFGQLDTAGFPKDSYYLFQAAWTHRQTGPMVHLFPWWDFSPGQPIDVRVCSNAPEAALYLNGACLGRKRLGTSPVADWLVPYQPGILEAQAYDEFGAVIASACQVSFGEAERLVLAYDHQRELSFILITALDSMSRPVCNANRRIKVKVDGGTLLGLDNGDPTDDEPYQKSSRRMFGGKLLALIRREAGRLPAVTAVFDEEDIPVRKIELEAEGLHVRARTLPLQAGKVGLIWRLTNAAGIDSGAAELMPDGEGYGVTVKPLGDGEVFVRCGTKNGRDHQALYSLMPLTLKGYGQRNLDPFSFVSAGLFSWSNVELTSGNDRGVATLRDRESHVCFENLDFGLSGSDELTLWLFPLTHEPFPFEIWEGIPLQGGEKLLTQTYDKGMVWNTYQETNCLLPRRLSGIRTLSFVFGVKTHFKGFTFRRKNRAYDVLQAGLCDELYGDTFTKAGDAVENIGNNVTLTFRNLDFEHAGTDSVCIRWRSGKQENTAQILFSGAQRKARVMLRLPPTDNYTEEVFPLGRVITGLRDVSFIFLPGSSLDLAWIRFIQIEPEDGNAHG